jgi:hypothetical protein
VSGFCILEAPCHGPRSEHGRSRRVIVARLARGRCFVAAGLVTMVAPRRAGAETRVDDTAPDKELKLAKESFEAAQQAFVREELEKAADKFLSAFEHKLAAAATSSSLGRAEPAGDALLRAGLQEPAVRSLSPRPTRSRLTFSASRTITASSAAWAGRPGLRRVCPSRHECRLLAMLAG